MQSQELSICIVGAAGQIATSFYALLGTGQVFGQQIGIHLRLLDLSVKMTYLIGIKMQIEDCAFQLVKSTIITDQYTEAFNQIDVVIFLGGLPREPGMERSELLSINNLILQEQGKVLNSVAKRTVKVLMVSNPSNTNCIILAESCPQISTKNFTSLMMIDHNRCVAMLAKKAGVPSSSISNFIVWGNHSLSSFPDTKYTTICGQPIQKIINDSFLKDEFFKKVQNRGGALLAISKQTCFISAANAIKDHLQKWYFGTNEEEYNHIYQQKSVIKVCMSITY